MNQYQRAAALVIRIFGCALIAWAAVGPFYVLILWVLWRVPPVYSKDHLSGTAWWLFLGVLLISISKPLGRLLGRGLE